MQGLHFSTSAQNKKQFSIFILPVRPNILVSPPFEPYFAAHDTYCIFTATGADCKVCSTNLRYVWGLLYFIIGTRHSLLF